MQYRLVWVAIALSMLFWLGDSVLDGVFFENTGYFSELWPDEPKELWMRWLLVGGILLFGMFAQVTVNRQEQARQQLMLAGAVLHHSNDAILVTDAEIRIVDVNPAFERTSGYSRDEVLGKNPRLFSFGEHDNDFYRAFWEQLTRTDSWEGEIHDRRKSGEVYPKWMSVTTIRDSAGTVSHYVASSRDISDIKATAKRLEHLAHYDTLSGLPNRSLLIVRLEQALSLAHRNHWTLAVVFIDLDHFKEVNDSLGHSTGDRLLTEVGKRLLDCVRESDTVARLGGDEFVIVLDNVANPSVVSEVLGKLKDTLGRPVSLDGYELFVTASMGISLYPEDGQDPEVLLRNADSAMYHVKRQGRNHWGFYSERMNEQSRRRLQLTSGLRQAIEKNQFSLVYQPQLALATRSVCGAEALVRWEHPELGEISPLEFIPLAEDTGIIEEIGEWVLQEACRQIVAWSDHGVCLPRISVNVSARQFKSANFIKRVEQLVQKHRLAPGCLDLEITESLLVRTDARLLNDMQRLCDIGVVFSVDDFGTGYSSLSYLKRFPISMIKADRSFVCDIPDDRDDIEITAAIISMSHKLNIRVIAEGVETLQQLDFLSEQGCDEMQGYLFSHPLSQAAFEAFIKEPELSFLEQATPGPSTSGNTDRTRGVRQGTTTRHNGQHNNNKDDLDEP
jgi:diguanylate cyclase (GGDEF)-like protein/PAS domain S-box-containing protein